MAHPRGNTVPKLPIGTKLTPEQIKKMFVLWLLMSGNFPTNAGDNPVNQWDALIAPHVMDLPNIKDNFKTLYENRQPQLSDASSVMKELYNGISDEVWNGSGDCFFSIHDIVSIFP